MSRPSRWAYCGLALLMALLAIAGFWPSYFGHIGRQTMAQPLVIHVHAVVFTGWLAILFGQAWLAATGRLTWHRRLGTGAFVYGVVLVVIGWYTAIAMSAARAAGGDVLAARATLYVPFTDLVFFVPLLAAAWVYRRQPEVHKRLIVVATTALLIAAAHRLVGTTIRRPPPLLPVLAVWLSPVLVGMAIDQVTRGRVHPVYGLGVIVVLAMKFRPRLQGSDAWASVADWLFRLVA